FTVTYDQNNHLMMEIDDVEETLFLETYRTVFADGVFHFPAREQMNIIQQLQKIGTKNQAMPISETQKDQFFSETLPILKRNAENIKSIYKKKKKKEEKREKLKKKKKKKKK